MVEGKATGYGWFDVQESTSGVFIIEEPHHFERVKSYLIVGDERAMLLDTGMNVADIKPVVEALTRREVFVVNSHAHWDHIGGNHRFREVWIHENEASEVVRNVGNDFLRRVFQPEALTGPLPPGVTPERITIPAGPQPRTFQDGQVFDLGGRRLEALHCPGHSSGGVALIDRASGLLFSTDIAYMGELYVFRDSDVEPYARSLERLAALVPDLQAVYPSHNESPISPEVLPPMARAMREIADGRDPDWEREGVTAHEFEGFSVQLIRRGE